MSLSTCENEYCRKEYSFDPDVEKPFICPCCRSNTEEHDERYEID